MRIKVHFMCSTLLLSCLLWSVVGVGFCHSGKLVQGLQNNKLPMDNGMAEGSSFLTSAAAFLPETSMKHLHVHKNDPRKARRLSPGKPTSLDLTFHMLRELMETSRAERMSQKAKINKYLLKALGKRSYS
uniref:Corticotropin-releasing factor domain-containing protein n=1 Tax=Electrophorus electricus TaxID=8005 RepID=A0A4W4GBB6_ELEEL